MQLKMDIDQGASEYTSHLRTGSTWGITNKSPGSHGQRPLVTGHWLLATGSWLLAPGYSRHKGLVGEWTYRILLHHSSHRTGRSRGSVATVGLETCCNYCHHSIESFYSIIRLNQPCQGSKWHDTTHSSLGQWLVNHSGHSDTRTLRHWDTRCAPQLPGCCKCRIDESACSRVQNVNGHREKESALDDMEDVNYSSE